MALELVSASVAHVMVILSNLAAALVRKQCVSNSECVHTDTCQCHIWMIALVHIIWKSPLEYYYFVYFPIYIHACTYMQNT